MHHLILGPQDERLNLQINGALLQSANRVARRSNLTLSAWVRLQMAKEVVDFDTAAKRRRQDEESRSMTPADRLELALRKHGIPITPAEAAKIVNATQNLVPINWNAEFAVFVAVAVDVPAAAAWLAAVLAWSTAAAPPPELPPTPTLTALDAAKPTTFCNNAAGTASAGTAFRAKTPKV